MALSKRKKSSRKARPTAAASTSPRSPRTSKALDELLSAARLNPDNIEAAFALAAYYLHQGDHERIPSVLATAQRRVESLDPVGKTRLRRLLAFGYAATRELDKAELCIERGIEAAPNTLDLWFVRSYVAMAMGNWASAVIAGDRYLELLTRVREGAARDTEDFAVTPAHEAQLLNIVGSALLERRKIAAAIERFETAIARDPGNHLPYLNLIRAHERQGNRDEMQRVCARGLTACRTIQELRLRAAAMEHRVTVCACLIVKDEEAHLPRCLESIRSWVDDIVVVDTGSSDRTVDIAQSYGARIYHHAWEGDFSKHRNQSIEYATGDWILIIDADEEFVAGDVARVRSALENPQTSVISLNVFNIYADGRDSRTFLPSIRLFRRSLNLRYEGIVHNQLAFPPATRITRVNAAIRHYGYSLAPEVMEQKLARTRALLETQLAATPDDPFALFNYAQLLRSTADGFDSDLADTIIETAQKVVDLTDPLDRTERHLHLMCLNHIAWCQHYKKNYDAALAFADRALAIRSDYLDPLFLRGHVYSQRGDFERAREAYEAYLRAQARYEPSLETENLILLHVDSRAGAWYGLALCEQAGGRTAAEAAWYRKVVELHPGYLEAASRLGQLELADGNVDEAARLFHLQLEHGRPTITAFLGLAYLAKMRGERAEEEYYYRQAIDCEPADSRALVRLARLYLEQERFIEALELLDNEPGSGDEYLRLAAQVYYQTGRYAQAIPVFEHLLKTTSGDSGILNDLANCFARLERHREAETLYRRALAMNPAEVAAARNLGVTLLRLNRPGEAVQALEGALRHNERQPDVCHMLGDIYSSGGDYERALPMYERVLHEQPKDSLALYRLAECYLAMGHKDAARMGYAKVLEFEAGFEPARHRLSQLSGTWSEDVDSESPESRAGQKISAPLLS